MSWLPLLASAVLVGSPPACEPPICSCLPFTRPIEEAVRVSLQDSDAVVVGRVLRVELQTRSFTTPDGREYPDPVLVATLGVERRWKGPPADTLEVTTSAHGTMCGFDFEEGGSYLVYATGGPGGEWSTTSCSRTAPVAAAGRELQLLRDLTSGDPLHP